MLRKLLPILLAVGGLGGGIAAGLSLRPAVDETTHSGSDDYAGNEGEAEEEGEAADGTGPEYVKLNNQFVVPVVNGGLVSAMVVLSLSLEVEPGSTEAVYEREPKLRDALLQVLFDHANIGGFNGSFTDGANLVLLRTSLKEAAGLVLGTVVRDVLITDIARQDS